MMDLREAVDSRHAAIGSEVQTLPSESFGPIDPERVLALIGLNPRDPKAHAVIAVAKRYGLDPVLGHILILPSSRMPYITRDGFLHIAHRSGKLDGIEVADGPRRVGGEWYVRVSVFRTDMGRPFTYPGRAEVSAGNGPELAIARAERRALKRAFAVTVPTVFAEDADDAPRTVAPTLRALLADELGTDGPGPTDEAGPMTEGQRRAMFARFAELGLERPERLGVVSRILGRQVGTSNELTEQDATRILSALRDKSADEGSAPNDGDAGDGTDGDARDAGAGNAGDGEHNREHNREHGNGEQ
jgi:hypothetical protein